MALLIVAVAFVVLSARGAQLMQFDLLRLVLVRREQAELLERRGPQGQPLNREAWLRVIFSESIEFIHYGNDFHFVPQPERPPSLDDGFVLGRIGRRYHALESEPPEEGLTEIIHSGWTAASVVIDPRTHEDGHKVAFEVLSRVGTPLSVFESLLRTINNRPEREPFVAEVNPIVDPDTFWEFERENRGEITLIEFDLMVPNMFGTRNDLDRELRELRDNERVRKAKLALENEDGLNLNTERNRQTVNYTLEGGGGIKAKAKRKKHKFNSKRKGKRITIETSAAEQPETFFSKVGQVIARVFGT